MRAKLIAIALIVAIISQANTIFAQNKPITYVLVHGTWHGGWCWNKLIPHLESAGHRALAVTLTGQGDRAHLINPSVDLSTHVTDVVSVLEMDDLSDVILVGHSYGGLVVCGAAERHLEQLKVSGQERGLGA